MAIFVVSDFFTVPISKQKSGAKLIDVDALKDESKSDSVFGKLLAANGVYVFSIKAGRGRKPWYVGKSEKSTFLKEAFNERNKNALAHLINNRKGTLQVSFCTQAKSRGKPNLKQIGEIEYLLIGHAAERNSALLNKQNKLQIDDFCIKNIYNSGAGKAASHEKAFKSLIGL